MIRADDKGLFLNLKIIIPLAANILRPKAMYQGPCYFRSPRQDEYVITLPPLPRFL